MRVVLSLQPGHIRNTLKCERISACSSTVTMIKHTGWNDHEDSVGPRYDQTHSSLRLLQHLIASDFTRIAHIDSHLPL